MINFMVKLPETARPINKCRTTNFLVVYHRNDINHIQIIWKLNQHM